MGVQRNNSQTMIITIVVLVICLSIFCNMLLFKDMNHVVIENTIEITENDGNISEWMDLYNKTKLKQEVKLTFTKYTERFDRIRPSTESLISINNSTILFHPQFQTAKIGPLISLYWHSRMMSFFSQFYKFKLVLQQNKKKHYKIFFNDEHYFSFLPKESDIHAIDIDYDLFSKYQDWILFWMLSSRPPKTATLYVYKFDLMELMESKIFTDIMRYETNMAFNEYYRKKSKNGLNGIKQQNLIKNEMWISKTDDILIHIRCQDVLINGQPKYGMSSLHYFYYGIKNVFNITLYDKMAIHIVLFLGDIPGKHGKAKNNGGCNIYLYKYLYPVFIKIFHPAQIKLIVNGTVDDDFYRFIKAPNLICGASSYCLMGAIANENNVVLYKQWTPKKWYKWENYELFGPIADNIHYLDDPYFVSCNKTHYNQWNVHQIAHEMMIIDGKYVTL